MEEKPINLGKLPKNEPIKYKEAEEPPISQIKSNSQINNRYKTKVDPSKVVADWIMPCEGVITSYYGKRKQPVAGASTLHSGIDIKVPVGTPVRAIADGKIIIASGGIKGYGNAIYINHGNIKGNIVESEYGHLSKINVHKNQNVKQGEIIGLSGGKPGTPGAGYSTGPHLHITIREGGLHGKPINPLFYIDN